MATAIICKTIFQVICTTCQITHYNKHKKSKNNVLKCTK